MLSNHNKIIISILTLSIGGLGLYACSNKNAEAKLNFVVKENANKDVAAKLAGKEITHNDIRERAKLRIVELEKQIYSLKIQELNNMTREHVLKMRADEAKLSVDEFVDKKVVSGKIKVTDKEFNEFIESRGRDAKNIDAALKERIMKFLEDKKRDDQIEAYVASWTRSNPVEVYFDRPRVQIDVELGQAPLWGSESAPVTIVEFSDFQCPFCSRANDTVNELKSKYKNKIKVAFKHFPLPNHKEALPASEASMCINEQDSKKFWAFHDKLFKNQQGMDPASLEKYAKEVGANVQKFKECFDGGKYKSHVQNDIAYGSKIGVESTPTFFINGELVAGAQPIEKFQEIIDAYLTAKQ